jgi:hypothetical protein
MSVENPLFKNWMVKNLQHISDSKKTSSTTKFQKLWGRINTDIPKGTYSLKLSNSKSSCLCLELDASGLFDGTKKVVFTTSNLIGGKNTTMFLAFLTLSLLLLFAMSLTLIVSKRKKKLRMFLTNVRNTKTHEFESSLSDSENFFVETKFPVKPNPEEATGI